MGKYWGRYYTFLIQSSQLRTANTAKAQTLKNGSNSSIYDVTGSRLCIPLMVHKNEQLLFFDQKISRPNQTSGGHFMFLKNLGFLLWQAVA